MNGGDFVSESGSSWIDFQNPFPDFESFVRMPCFTMSPAQRLLCFQRARRKFGGYFECGRCFLESAVLVKLSTLVVCCSGCPIRLSNLGLEHEQRDPDPYRTPRARHGRDRLAVCSTPGEEMIRRPRFHARSRAKRASIFRTCGRAEADS